MSGLTQGNQVSYSGESDGVVFWDISTMATNKPKDARNLSFVPHFLYESIGFIERVTDEEFWFIDNVWNYWALELLPQRGFRVWGKLPSQVVLTAKGFGDEAVRRITQELADKDLLFVSGEIYDFTPFLQALLRKLPEKFCAATDEVLQKVWR